MVVDMLSTSQEQIPPQEEEEEEDGRNSSLAAACADHDGDRRPRAVRHVSAVHRSHGPGGSSACRRLKTARMKRSDGADASEQQRLNSSERDSMESHKATDESRLGDPEVTRLCKRKLDLTLSSGSCNATKAQDSEKKDPDPESPPPAKKWVIGPLFQSFKSKMASFTEIVMSPVRLFKSSEVLTGSNDAAPSATHEKNEDEGTDSKDDIFSKEEEKVTPVTKLQVVQRLRFNTNSSDASDTEQNKVTVLQNRSERARDLIPEDDGSFGSEKQNSECTDPLSHPCTGLRKTPGSGEETQKQKVLEELTRDTRQAGKSRKQTQDQPLTKKSRLPTPAVGKRKKGRAQGGGEVVENDGAVGTGGVEESPVILESPRLVQSDKRKKVQVTDDHRTTCSTADAWKTSGLYSCPTSEGKKKGQTRAPRSKSKREKDVKGTSVVLDVTGDARLKDPTPAENPASSGSVTLPKFRTTRRHNNNKVCKERKSDIADDERACGDSEERLKPRDGTSESKPVRKNTRHTRHKSDTCGTSAAKQPHDRKKNSRRIKSVMDVFEDQGMSMSLTLKVGSGVGREKETSSIMTCGITTIGRKMGEGVMLADASCPSRTAREHLEKKVEQTECRVCLDRIEAQDEVEQEDESKPGLVSSGGLKRSLSCPDIASLQHASDAPGNDRPLYCPPSPLKKVPHLNANAPSPVKRARRHTVCSVEIEREIAPLCLRKEVYPTWSNHSYPHSPSKSLATLVSCFLSSPLAFLSKKTSRGNGSDDSGYGASSSDLALAVSSSPSPPLLLRSPASSRVAGGSALFADAPQTPEQSSMSSHCSVFDAVSMEAEGALQQDTDENEPPSAMSEERALSDSEIKTDNKQLERRKVSSIRIRKTLPKPQYNLTPMGLPKAVRIKKKVFSVEEIYTNKNFSKPPEGRLETIFEVPLSRRDGSESLVGLKRLKRFVEFPELGVVRKPKRPLVGGAGGGGAQRKAAGNPGTGRTRRGREEEAIHLQDFDSLLCSKLDELDVWMAREQMVY